MHFDEWWGEKNTMGDVLSMLHEELVSVVMSKAKLPFAEAKSCSDRSCMFCPCGAINMLLTPNALFVNGQETMLLHLAESKPSWTNTRVPPYDSKQKIFHVHDIGQFNGQRGMKYVRHRAVGKYAAMITYGRTRVTVSTHSTS